MMHIPRHVLDAHVFPHLPIDTRRALGVPPGKLDMAAFDGVRDHLARRPRIKSDRRTAYHHVDFPVPSPTMTKFYMYSVSGFDIPRRQLVFVSHTAKGRWTYTNLHTD